VRALLLEQPEILRDTTYAQQLVEELHAVEKEGGLLWRLHQAGLWLAGDGWREKQAPIEALLRHCMSADPPWTAPSLLLGRMYELLGDVARAQEVYRGALQQNPAALEVADRLMTLLTRTRQFTESKAVLAQLDAAPRDLGARRIDLALRSGQHAEALKEVRLRVAGDPNDAQALVLLGRLVYLEQNDAAAALRYLDQAEKLAANVVSVAAARAWVLKNEQRVDEARRLLDGVVEKEQSPEAYMLRAQFLTSLGEIEPAEADYQALARFPNDPRGHLALSEFYRDHGRLAEAIAALEQGCAAYPEDVSLKGTLMNALLARNATGDRPRAEALLGELESQLPDAPEVLRVRAYLLLQSGDAAARSAAQELLERVVQRRPTDVDAHLARIAVALDNGDRASARERAIAALGANPRDARLLLARARVERTLRDPRAAWELARQALVEDPANLAAFPMLVGAALDTGAGDVLAQTETLLRERSASRPELTPAQIGLAVVLRARGETEAAIAGLEEYRQRGHGQELDVLLTLSDLHRRGGDREVGHQRLQEAVAVAPDDPAVFQALLRWAAADRDFDQVTALVARYRGEHPDDVDVTLAGSMALAASERRADRESARGWLEQLVARAPRVTGAQITLGLLAHQAGDAARAERAFRDALAAEPDNADALNNLAWLLAETRAAEPAALAEALDLANQAVGLDPENVHYLDTRGEVLTRLPGRAAAARADLEKCARLTPENSGARAKAALRVAGLCAQLNEPQNTLRFAAEAADIDRGQGVLTAEERQTLNQLVEQFGGLKAPLADR
jgi:tetratricopeptide (TPR) repeat protein